MPIYVSDYEPQCLTEITAVVEVLHCLWLLTNWGVFMLMQSLLKSVSGSLTLTVLLLCIIVFGHHFFKAAEIW